MRVSEGATAMYAVIAAINALAATAVTPSEIINRTNLNDGFNVLLL